MQKYSQRIKGMPESIFSTMTRLAFEYKAVNLGQGFPDFDGPTWLFDKAYEAMKAGANQYAPSQGIHSLRRIFADITKAHYGLDYDPDNEITVTAGATEGLFSSILALINPGDEVIILEPFYDGYEADVALAGGIPKYLTLRLPDFSLNHDELRNSISPKTKAIIINTPHNPTGKVFSLEELQQIADVALEYDLLLLSDEVYEFLIYDGAEHISIASLAGMKERTVRYSSTGKTFGMTGWKVGFTCAPPEITHSIRQTHQWVNFAVNTPAQHAMKHGFERLTEYLPEFQSLYEAKRDFLYNGLLETPFKPHLPKGSYFIMAEFPQDKFKDDIDCATRLVKEYGAAVIPPSPFYKVSGEGSKMIRLCFAKKQETLKLGLDALKRV